MNNHVTLISQISRINLKMETKTIKTPLTTAETCGLSCWPSSLAPESKLSHNLEFHPDLVPRLSHHRGKNTALRAEKPFPQCAAFFSEAQRNGVLAFSWL